MPTESDTEWETVSPAHVSLSSWSKYDSEALCTSGPGKGLVTRSPRRTSSFCRVRTDQARCVSAPSQSGMAPARRDGATPKVDVDASRTRRPGGPFVESVSHWNDSVDRRYEHSFRSASAPGL